MFTRALPLSCSAYRVCCAGSGRCAATMRVYTRARTHYRYGSRACRNIAQPTCGLDLIRPRFLTMSPSIQARLAQASRAMYARLSGTTRYQALTELAQQARSAIGITAAGNYKDFMRLLLDSHCWGRFPRPCCCTCSTFIIDTTFAQVLRVCFSDPSGPLAHISCGQCTLSAVCGWRCWYGRATRHESAACLRMPWVPSLPMPTGTYLHAYTGVPSCLHQSAPHGLAPDSRPRSQAEREPSRA